MELVAAIILIALAVAGAWYAGELLGPKLGSGALATVARFALTVALLVVAVFCLWVVFDGDEDTVGATVPCTSRTVDGVLIVNDPPNPDGCAGL